MIQASKLLKFATQLSKSTQTLKLAYNAGDKPFKQREEAAEKIYISQQEKKTLKTLLNKIEDWEMNEVQNDAEFERRLKEIMKRYNLDNEAFFAEVNNLHKNM